MTTDTKVREKVSKAYARAVTEGSGCCTPTTDDGCCALVVPKGAAAQTAGYTPEELSGLPPEAVVNSFGCGNPLAFSEVKEGDVVLDLGSGAGIDILLAAQKVGPQGRAIGIDMTDEMIAKAEESIAASGLANVEVRKGLIEELPVESASVDWVISNCVINLSPDKPKVFAEIARVLKPGGQMQVSDIVVEGLPAWMRAVDAVYNSCVGGAISEGEYLGGLEAAGLEGVEVRERVVHEASQLASIVLSELPDTSSWLRQGGPASEALVRRLAKSVEGKVWSAKFYARKPA